MKPCYWPIEQLPGFSQENVDLLKAIGILNTKQLLERAKSTDSKQILAAQLGIHFQYIKKWTALADLARIPSVGCGYCGLWLHSGIASVSQLTQTPVHRLQGQVLRLQVATMGTKDLCPTVGQMQKWIQQGRSLLPSDNK